MKIILTIILIVLNTININAKEELNIKKSSREERKRIGTLIYKIMTEYDSGINKLLQNNKLYVDLFEKRSVLIKEHKKISLTLKSNLKDDELQKELTIIKGNLRNINSEIFKCIRHNPLTKDLDIEKYKKISYLHKHGDLKGFDELIKKEQLIKKAEIEKIKELNLIKENIKLLTIKEKELSSEKIELGKEYTELVLKIIKEKFNDYNPVSLQKKNINLKKELNEYKKELIQKQFPETVELYKKNDYLCSLSDRVQTGETINWSEEKITGIGMIEEKVSNIFSKIESYKIVPDEKYTDLKKELEKVNDIAHENMIKIKPYIDNTPKGKQMKDKLDNISKELDVLSKKRKELSLQLTKMPHKHSANCNH